MSKKGKKQKVQVWVYHRDGLGVFRFLILQTRPERGGFWQPVTGSVDEGEGVPDAALREAQEETALTFPVPPLPVEGVAGKFQYEKQGQIFEEYGFAVETPGPESPAIRLDPHEHEGYEWVLAEEALRRVKFSSNSNMLKALIKQLWGSIREGGRG